MIVTTWVKKWITLFVLIPISWSTYSQQIHPIIGWRIHYTDQQGYENIAWVQHEGGWISPTDIQSTTIDVPYNGKWYFKVVSVNDVNCDGAGSTWFMRDTNLFIIQPPLHLLIR